MKLEQALFGYKGGHRRLASSSPFQPGDERFLVRMTDLSGSRMITGFEEYLSGYVLPSGAAYVFAKTWYAPECERPGCVWTHALFIAPGDWESLAPEQLCSLFKRPEAERAGWDYYATALSAVLASRSPCAPMPNKSDCSNLVEALYTDSLPIICSVEDGGSEFERLLMQLTWQRPLSLRGTFSFCTGALSFLRAEHEPLRVQVMPARVVKATREDALRLTPGRGSREHDPWVNLLVEDLFENDVVLRFVLEPFQARSSSLSESGAVDLMRKVAELCVSYKRFESALIATPKMLELVAAAFPLAADQVALKKRVLERATKAPNGRSDLLRFVLAVSNHSGAYADLKSVITDAAASFSRENPSEAVTLLGEHLFKPRTGDISENVLKEILASLDVRRLSENRPVDSQILYALAQQQPKATSDSIFWLLQQSFEESAELADMLTERLGEHTILSALLSAGRFDLLLRMLRLQGAPGAYKAFRLARPLKLGDEDDYRKLIALRGELNHNAQTVVMETQRSSERCNSAQLFLLSSLNVEPATLASLVPDIETWLEAVRVLPRKLERIHAVTFFLACGDEFPEGWRLVSKSFDLLHDSVGNKSLPLEWWWLVKSRLPSLALWEKWDKCERLRRGLVDTFLRKGWSQENLRLCTHSDWLYQKLLDTYRGRAH